MPATQQRGVCPICQRTFVPSRRDQRYCRSACRQKAHRDRHSPEPLPHPRELPQEAVREARLRLRAMRARSGLGDLVPSRRLELEAGRHAARCALDAYERLLDATPPGPKLTTLVYRPDWLGLSEVEAAQYVGLGAARGPEGNTILVIIVGANPQEPAPVAT